MMNIQLTLNDDKERYLAFSSLMHLGFKVKTTVGTTIKALLCSQFDVPVDTLENWLKIIFLNGKPVDHPETATVKVGSTIALSPYLGGIACRSLQRDSPISTFRDGITHHEEDIAPATPEEAMVTIKLFNLAGSAIGPILLQQGIWVTGEDLEVLFKNRWNGLSPYLLNAKNSDQEITLEELAAIDWSNKPENILLRVVTESSPSKDEKVI